jgi:glycosyltransferase involved in cell wall biosynthesis
MFKASPLISIIVPIYIVPEKYLRKCIDSLVKQTYQNIEIILVNDGSPDRCREICKEYESYDHRILILSQDNKGLSVARNIGVKAASGEWFTFVDGDDWIEPNFCETMYNATKENDVQLVLCMKYRDIGERTFSSFPIRLPNDVLLGSKNCKRVQLEILNFNAHLSSVNAKLYKKSFIFDSELFHDEDLKYGVEGIEYSLRVFGHLDKIALVKEFLYHYVYNNKSITQNWNEESICQSLLGFNKISSYITTRPNKQELEEVFLSRLVYVIVATAISGYFHPNNAMKYKDKKDKMIHFLQTPLISHAMNRTAVSKLTLLRRIAYILIKRHAFFFVCIMSYGKILVRKLQGYSLKIKSSNLNNVLRIK